jgi:chlorite dismutase
VTTKPAPQIVKYSFYKVDSAWRRLASETRARDKRELAGVLESASQKMMIRAYSTMGMRGDSDMLIWTVSEDFESVRTLASEVAHTHLGTYLDTTYSYLAMTRHSTYVEEHEHEGSESRLLVRPMNLPYFFVYPFVKTHSWYQLPDDERQRMMTEHFKVGHRYPEVRIHTSYSYGLDDQEFVLGFETSSPERFLELIIELRAAEQRPYTELDVPIFTCLLGTVSDVLDTLGG